MWVDEGAFVDKGAGVVRAGVEGPWADATSVGDALTSMAVVVVTGAVAVEAAAAAAGTTAVVTAVIDVVGHVGGRPRGAMDGAEGETLPVMSGAQVA
jgi:hypothetical protein